MTTEQAHQVDAALLEAAAAGDAVRLEAARLAELRAYGILDTPPEAAFDRIVDLARTLFDTPIALVTFVDQTRQWFKAKAGVAGSETPRELAFCAHAIRSDATLVIPDASLDPRFADNPLVTGAPHVRFYAGAPLRTPTGARLGAVCVVSPEPRAGMSEGDLRRLEALAGIAANELELRRQLGRAQRLAAERDLLRRELEHRSESILRLVTSVIEAQARRRQERAQRQVLYETADRIEHVGMLHEQIRCAASMFGTDTRAYLLALVGNLQDAGLDDRGARSVSMLLSPELDVAVERLGAVGMVVVELVTDALLTGQGEVKLRIDQGEGCIVITMRHDGLADIEDPRLPALRDRSSLSLVAELALPDGIALHSVRPYAITVRMAA